MTTQPAPRCPHCGPCVVYTSIWHGCYCSHCGCPIPAPPPPPPEARETEALVREALAHMPRAVTP